MRKTLCFALSLLVLLTCLTGCGMAKKVMEALSSQLDATPKVEEMMLALAENRASDARAFMHPDSADGSEKNINQMIEYLNGRTVSTLTMVNVRVNNFTGTDGRYIEEQATYIITLTDGTELSLDAFYRTDSVGSGFSTFRLSMGVV